VHLRYEGSDTPLIVDFDDAAGMRAQFETVHRQRFGFAAPDKPLIVEAVAVEGRGRAEDSKAFLQDAVADAGPLPAPGSTVTVHTTEGTHDTPIYDRAHVPADTPVPGPAIITEPNSTIVIEPGWQAVLNERAELLLTRVVAKERAHAIGTAVDPVMLEIFNNLFMSIAEQMGSTLQNTASSVNIKERLDFSCAVFDATGNLVANAPHMPVHLGSMSESIKTVIRERGDTIKQGDVYVLNAPYNGGTHLPDVTVITPVFDEDTGALLFFTGSRGHQADIGGISPGSMPPDSTTIDQEGILIDNFTLVDGGHLREAEMLALLNSGPYPARNSNPSSNG
jgi:5-oxoprolinase (ATP-hydrolysing)